MTSSDGRQRNLTDDDVDAIVSRFQERFTKQFYLDLGKGVWSFAWKAIVLAIIGFAAYGHLGSGK